MVFLGGQFKSATHGQFKSAQGGQFDRILQLIHRLLALINIRNLVAFHWKFQLNHYLSDSEGFSFCANVFYNTLIISDLILLFYFLPHKCLILRFVLQNTTILFLQTRKFKCRNYSCLRKVFPEQTSHIKGTNDELKNICQVEHSRHRSFTNFLSNLISGFITYSFLQKNQG